MLQPDFNSQKHNTIKKNVKEVGMVPRMPKSTQTTVVGIITRTKDVPTSFC